MQMAKRTLATIALATITGAPALAQNISNEVWIGQTGNTNTISIVQQGESNTAGADNVFLRLSQDGNFNALSIDQYGWSNNVAPAALEAGRPIGLNQVGDLNEIDISQTNSAASGSNLVGAIYQESPRNLVATPNSLEVLQTDVGGTSGAAGHALRSIRQINTTANATANTARVTQSGGNDTDGNTVDQLSQEGAANAMDLTQSGSENVLDFANQFGTGNEFVMVQENGDANTTGVVQQIGDLNRVSVRQAGSRNHALQIYQNNENLNGAGNRAKLMVTGEDNGGDGLGGLGQFVAAATLGVSGVQQGEISQIGDDNDASLTITEGSLNQFGISQIGDGNGVLVSIAAQPGEIAEGNETATLQDGLDNDYTLTVIGNGNAAAASQTGERNNAYAFQTGDQNIIEIEMVGDDNNVASLGGFSDQAGVVADTVGLPAGEFRQTGSLNSASVLVEGSTNLVGTWQSGDSHEAMVSIFGSGNQLAVVQTGFGNISMSVQTGDGNNLGVRQF